MKNAARIIVGLSTLLSCGTAYAMEQTTWDFRGSVPAGATPQHLTTVEIASQGMYVRTDTDGLIQFEPLTVRADSLTLTITNVSTPRVALLWRTSDMNETEYYQQYITLPTGSAERAIVDLDALPEWDWTSSTLALAFPAGAELLIEKAEWKAYSFSEKLANRFISFWTPDTFKMYSINFLWGPLISATPEGRSALYEELPPRAWSATRVLYALFALAMIIAIITRFVDPVRGPARAKTILLVAGAALWILFDARMTQEIVSYAARDWSTYVLAPKEERVLRTHSGLYDVLRRTDELLGDDERYVLVTREGTPFFSNVRYVLYPAIPVGPFDLPSGQAGAIGTTAWIVLGMPGISVKDGVIVASDGTPLSPKGAVVEKFDETSFFFRTL